MVQKGNKNQDVIAYVKNTDDGTLTYVEEVGVGKEALSVKSMFERKKSLAVTDISC